MKTKLFFAIALMVILALNATAQNDWTKPGLGNPQDMKSTVDYSPSQVAGYCGIGVGAVFIGYTAFSNDTHIKNPALNYVIGGALLATGISFLIWGDTEKGKPNYWKGMPSSYYIKKNNRKRYFMSFNSQATREKIIIQ